MGTTVAAVKAALVRARARIAARVVGHPVPVPAVVSDAEQLRRYAELFNARSWDGLGLVDGVPALAVFRGDARHPAYFVLVEWQGGRCTGVSFCWPPGGPDVRRPDPRSADLQMARRHVSR